MRIDRAVFQPIFEASGGTMRIHALECVSHGNGVDYHGIVAAIREAAVLPSSTRMHIDVHASTVVSDPDLAQFITWSARAHEVQPSRIVIEIDPPAPATDNRSFQDRLEKLRAAGMRIAIDHVGIRCSNYTAFLDFRPDYLKVDRYLVSGVDRDRSRQAALRSIVTLAAGCGSRVIADGVDLGPELPAVRQAGIDLLQGFLLARPRQGSAIELEAEPVGVAS